MTQFGPTHTPGGIWILPALLGFWFLTVAIRWMINKVQRRRRGFGDFDHLFKKK